MKYLWILILFLSLLTVLCLKDPYKTLGVSKKATVPEIKRAYKQLAREWHPDKNKSPGAEETFIEINKAYELLMDPERRRQFDRHGITEDTPNFRQRPDYSQFKRFDFDPFESLFSQGGFHFQFNFNQGSVYHKHTVTSRAYENNIIPSSNTQPYLILFYGDLCFPCVHAEGIWQKIVQELEPLGMGFATVHSQHEGELSRKIGVNSLPYLIGVIDGRPIHYKDEQLSLVRVVEFSRRLFSSQIVSNIDDSSVDDFLNSWTDNRVRVLLLSKVESIRLRYLLIAYWFRSRGAFGLVKLGIPGTERILHRYNVNPNMESLLVFNENPSVPIATLSMSELASQTMKDVLEANKFLLLPRLSSQELFDQLCPIESVSSRKRLCVILITQNVESHDVHRNALRDFIQHGDFSRERIKFMFLYEEKQKEFVNALASGEGTPENPVLHLVILWRKEHDRVRYQWLDSDWKVEEDELNSTRTELESTLKQLLKTTEALPYDAKVSVLIDEHAHGLMTRIINRLILMADVLRDNISSYDLLPAVSVIMSIGFILLVGYIMSYLMQLEEERIQEQCQKEGKFSSGLNSKPRSECRLNIHELRGETYCGLVRLLKPGCRTVVLLTSIESKPKLLPNFYRAVYPYRKNKTLMFAFLMVEKNLEWYRRLLLQALGEGRELNINPKNCIGTVLSLNGHRKYFCVYHAKHAELGTYCKKKKKGDGKKNGEFIGFEDSSNESENSDVESGRLTAKLNDGQEYDNILFEEHLLDGLSNWLDRLFEGSTQRYYINFWPENMK